MVKYSKNIVDYIIRNFPTVNSDYMSYEFPNIDSMDDDSFPIKLLNALRRLMTLFNHDLPPCLQNSNLSLQKLGLLLSHCSGKEETAENA